MLITLCRKLRRENLSIVTRFLLIDFARKSKALTCWSQGLAASVCASCWITFRLDRSEYESEVSRLLLCLVLVHDPKSESRVPSYRPRSKSLTENKDRRTGGRPNVFPAAFRSHVLVASAALPCRHCPCA